MCVFAVINWCPLKVEVGCWVTHKKIVPVLELGNRTQSVESTMNVIYPHFSMYRGIFMDHGYSLWGMIISWNREILVHVVFFGSEEHLWSQLPSVSGCSGQQTLPRRNSEKSWSFLLSIPRLLSNSYLGQYQQPQNSRKRFSLSTACSVKPLYSAKTSARKKSWLSTGI